MSDSDMEISSDSESVPQSRGSTQFSSKFLNSCVSADMVAMIPMPPSDNTVTKDPSSSGTNTRSAGDNPSVTAMPLKKRWRQSLEQEPKKKKVSLEAYRQRRASGGDSGDSLLSTSGTDSASTSAQLKENVKHEHRLARELARQKLSIGELERRKAKLKKALKQIDAAAEASSAPNAVAKNEFDKFTEKQSRWLERRAREKQREVKLDRFTSSMDMPLERGGPSHRHKSRSTAAVPPNAEDARAKRSSGHQKKSEASAAKRSRSDLTSTLHCLQRAKEEVQRQLDLLRSPACSNHGAVKAVNGFKTSSSRLSPRKTAAGSPKHSSRT